MLCLLPQPVGCAGSITKAYLDDGSYSGANTSATVVGWGRTGWFGSFPDVLHSVDLKLLTNAQCEIYGYAGKLADSMICAIGDLKGGEDSCQGDSGGPLFVQQARAFCPAPSTVDSRGPSRLPPPLPPRPPLTPTLLRPPRRPLRLGREEWISSSALSLSDLIKAARQRKLQPSTRACPLTESG